jgi:hypothetical protein
MQRSQLKFDSKVLRVHLRPEIGSPAVASHNNSSNPSDEAALKLVYLALKNISERWTMPVKEWRAALNRFAILFEDRMPVL